VLDGIFDGVPDKDRYKNTLSNACMLYNLPIAY
jgi:hypothetical protein